MIWLPWKMLRRSCLTERAVKFVRKVLYDQSGATAIEYALVTLGISLPIIAIVNAPGTTLDGLFGWICAFLQ